MEILVRMFFLRVMILACVIVAAAPCARGQAVTASEWEVKAVLLYNLARFVEWPTNTFASTNSPLVIGILGRDPFGKIIDDVVKGETVNGRPLIVRRYETVTEARSSAHVLYIAARESAEVPPIIRQLQNRPILTVGETEYFARAEGGMVRFFPTPQGKIRLRINLGNTTAANLKVSSKLLMVAEVVKEGS